MTEDEFIAGLIEFQDLTKSTPDKWRTWIIQDDNDWLYHQVIKFGLKVTAPKARDLYRIHHSPLAKALS